MGLLRKKPTKKEKDLMGQYDKGLILQVGNMINNKDFFEKIQGIAEEEVKKLSEEDKDKIKKMAKKNDK